MEDSPSLNLYRAAASAFQPSASSSSGVAPSQMVVRQTVTMQQDLVQANGGQGATLAPLGSGLGATLAQPDGGRGATHAPPTGEHGATLATSAGALGATQAAPMATGSGSVPALPSSGYGPVIPASQGALTRTTNPPYAATQSAEVQRLRQELAQVQAAAALWATEMSQQARNAVWHEGEVARAAIGELRDEGRQMFHLQQEHLVSTERSAVEAHQQEVSAVESRMSSQLAEFQQAGRQELARVEHMSQNRLAEERSALTRALHSAEESSLTQEGLESQLAQRLAQERSDMNATLAQIRHAAQSDRSTLEAMVASLRAELEQRQSLEHQQIQAYIGEGAQMRASFDHQMQVMACMVARLEQENNHLRMLSDHLSCAGPSQHPRW